MRVNCSREGVRIGFHGPRRQPAGRFYFFFEAFRLPELHYFDDADVLAYSKTDLERALRDLQEAEQIINVLAIYLDPKPFVHIGLTIHGPEVTADHVKQAMLARLNGTRLFPEAQARIRESRKTPPK